jgi:hypothetical protein
MAMVISMLGRILCFSLFVIHSNVFAGGSGLGVDRDCVAVKKQEIASGVNLDSFKTDFMDYIAVNLALKYNGEEDPLLSPVLLDRLARLNKSQYRDFLIAEVSVRESIAKKSMMSMHQQFPQFTAHDITGFGMCYANELSDVKSDAFADAIMILNKTILGASFDIPDDEHRALVRQYGEEFESFQAARKQHKIAKVRAEERQRQKPTSNKANIGSFSVTANSCIASSKVGLESEQLEPLPQQDSKFLILDATFKNNSDSSQFIDAGSLLVSYGGKTYTYSGIELIFDLRYSLPATPVNPLVSYRTKLVYRIPGELTGTVRWQPGNNPNGVTVQCGSI